MSRQYFLPHGSCNLLTWRFRVKWGIAAEHDVDDNTKAPHITAL